MIKAIVFDWAGTTVDYGSQAPIIAFQQAFASFGITVPTAEIRADLGLDKLDHVKRLWQNQMFKTSGEKSIPTTQFQKRWTKFTGGFKQKLFRYWQRQANSNPGCWS